jgi:nucleoside-diphosphate-sugar epimerase
MMKKAIITGASGFLGRRLTKALTNAGVKVCALDRQPMPICDSVQFFSYDFDNTVLFIDEMLRDADILFHLAWKGVGADHRRNFALQQKNVDYLLTTMEMAKRLNIPKTIVLGSASEYAAGKMPIDGQGAPAPVDAYGAAKAACHCVARAWSAQNGLPLIWCVPSSVYGPGRDDNNAISYAIKTLLRGEKPVFTNLEQIWDYVYIDDFIEALMAIGERGVTDAVYALGCGEAQPLRNYIFAVRDTIDPGLSLGLGDLPYKNGKPDNAEMDISVLTRDTGWTPRIDFEIGIRKTIEYFKSCKR